MKHLSPERDERASLQLLLAGLYASERTLRRDLVRSEGRSGDWAIYGRIGHVYTDGDGYLLCVVADDEREQSARRWTNVKARLTGICRVTQDGDDEGCLYLDRLPAPHEDGVIREALGIKRKRQLSAEAKASLADRLSRKPTSSLSNGQPFV